MPPDYRLEEALGAGTGLRIAGIDEAGRGPLAGPVVAAAVVLDLACIPDALASRIDDSKLVPANVREALVAALFDCAEVAVGIASVEEIDRLNILQATMLAMRRACDGLASLPAAALVDGNYPPKLACSVQTAVGGDGLSLSIAAASLVAKVHRDTIMRALSGECPGYGWERNMGYGTPEHCRALVEHGVTIHHRKSFRRVVDALNQPALSIA
ncbi:MAG: ribonuclease HII [Acetobacterales bacterium]